MTPLSPTALEEAAKAAQAKRAELQHAPLARIYPDLCAAAITAYLAQMEKEGFVVVPVEPTEAMIDAASDFHSNGKWTAADDSIYGGIYRAMLAAAQNGDEPCK